MYPIAIAVSPQLTNRNRLTTFFRLILAIPHLILVGGLGFDIAASPSHHSSIGGEGGLLGTVAAILAIISWFTILFAGSHIVGIQQFTRFYLRWRVRAMAYFMLLADDYPPFGDGPYPATIEVPDAPLPRDRLSVALRLLLAIPHLIVLFFVVFAWCITTIVAWFLILFTGEYPAGLYDFGVGVMRWRLRVEAYVLLMTDQYPPFALKE